MGKMSIFADPDRHKLASWYAIKIHSIIPPESRIEPLTLVEVAKAVRTISRAPSPHTSAELLQLIVDVYNLKWPLFTDS